MHNPGLAAAPAVGIHARHMIPVAVLIAGLLLATLSTPSSALFAVSLPPSESTALLAVEAGFKSLKIPKQITTTLGRSYKCL